jgi:hypothetical protein
MESLASFFHNYLSRKLPKILTTRYNFALSSLIMLALGACSEGGSGSSKENGSSPIDVSSNQIDIALSCGLQGSIDERIKNCDESRVIPFSTITTVSRKVRADGSVKKYIRDDSTGKIWSPPADLPMSQSEAYDYCNKLGDPLGISNWHLPIEWLSDRDESRSEFIAAFGNPIGSRGADGYAYNVYISHAFPEMMNKVFWAYDELRGNYGRLVSVSSGKVYPDYNWHDGYVVCVTE